MCVCVFPSNHHTTPGMPSESVLIPNQAAPLLNLTPHHATAVWWRQEIQPITQHIAKYIVFVDVGGVGGEMVSLFDRIVHLQGVLQREKHRQRHIAKARADLGRLLLELERSEEESGDVVCTLHNIETMVSVLASTDLLRDRSPLKREGKVWSGVERCGGNVHSFSCFCQGYKVRKEVLDAWMNDDIWQVLWGVEWSEADLTHAPSRTPDL